MLPRDNRSPLVPTELLDNPPRTFVRREMASDGDITRPHNPIPPLSVPAGNPSQWHVHLEVRPEQLVALHRLGFTSGALAWRHGMERWQPLRDGDDGDSLADADAEWSDDEHESSAAREANDEGRHDTRTPKSESRRAFAFPRGSAGAPVGLVQATPVSTRPPPPSPDQVFDEMFSRPLPPPPRVPGSVPPRASDDGAYEPSSLPRDGDAGYHNPTALALVPRPAWLAQMHPTPVALERPISIPPPAILDNYGGQRAVVGMRTLWLGVGAMVVVSAAVAALVASLVWNLHARSERESLFAEQPAAALEPKKPAQTTPAENAADDAEPRPKSVSVDQLPLLSGTRTAAPVTITGSEATRPETREPARPAEDHAAASPRSTPKPEPAAAPVAAAPAVKQAPSGIDESIAARLAEESAPKPAAEEAHSSPAPSGPADRGAVARAIAQAARAAQSCGSSPENGQVIVKFAPSGSAQSIQLLKPFSNRDVNACVLRAMSRARINAFTGEAISVRKTLRW